MRIRFILLMGALAAALSGPSQAATVLNAGFETGDLSGWTHSAGSVAVVQEADDAIVAPPFGEHFTPTEGEYFAKLTAGSDAGAYTLLFQPFTVTVTSRLSFDAAFLAFDYLPYDDDGYVRVFSAGTNHVVFASSVGAVGDLGHTSWASFTSGALAADDYVLEAGVRNVDDPDATYASQLLLDNVRVEAAAVPEPTSWALMILSFGAAGTVLRRRKWRSAKRHGLI